MANYGIQCWDASGKLILDITDKITQIIWSGIMVFPRDSSTGPNWPNGSNNNFNNATSRLTVESEGFRNGTPFVIYHDHNGKYNNSGSKQLCGISQNMSWYMENETRMRITYWVFSPGWPRSQVISDYNNVDIPIMVGIY